MNTFTFALPTQHYFSNNNQRNMNTFTFALLAMAAVASAAPQYGHSNYFSGYKKPLSKPQYKKCKVVWKTVNKAGYKEVKEEKCDYVTNKVPVQDTKTVCEAGYEKKCENQWVCLDYPKQENLDYCQNKKMATNQRRMQEHSCRQMQR